jgi:4-methyl-5(b-hydroxyethyl)-thiazole monophosphate biosynthesis
VKRVLLLTFEGVELFEAAAFSDVLGWSCEYGEAISVRSAGTHPEVHSAFGLGIVPDVLLKNVSAADYDAVAVPGGFGSRGFYEDACTPAVGALLRDFHTSGKPVASICVGALVLGAAGLLAGRRATTYPLRDGERRLQLASYGAVVVDAPLVRDGNLLTSSGPSAAAETAFVLLEELTGAENTRHIRHLMGFAPSRA